jgi:DNA-binding transcriptional regulator YdaS (Cro superfamily)
MGKMRDQTGRNEGVYRAIQVMGSRRALREALGCNAQRIQGWLFDYIPPECAIEIERVTGGRVTRYEIDPKFFCRDGKPIRGNWQRDAFGFLESMCYPPSVQVKKIIKGLGGPTVVAEALGLTPQAVNKWRNGQIPAERAVEMERVFGVPRHLLRPDLFRKSDSLSSIPHQKPQEPRGEALGG